MAARLAEYPKPVDRRFTADFSYHFTTPATISSGTDNLHGFFRFRVTFLNALSIVNTGVINRIAPATPTIPIKNSFSVMQPD